MKDNNSRLKKVESGIKIKNLLSFIAFFVFLFFFFSVNFTSADITTGLVSHYKLDETSGTTAYDSAGTNTGTVTGATFTAGKIGNALSFNGTSDYVTVPYNSSLELGNTGSVSLWVKPSVTSPSQTRNLITYGGTSYNNGYLLNQHDTILRVYWMFGTAAITVNNAFTANVWSHIVLTNNNGALTAYVNGIQAGSGTSSGTIVNNYATYIGGVPTGWIETGNIDDVRVYNRVLSDAEIKILYLMGR